jgi:hypothetical protein
MPTNSYAACTIKRIMKITSYRMDMLTGALSDEVTETRERLCATPLFHPDERQTGICNSCAKGFSVEGNIFANEVERERAAKSRPVPEGWSKVETGIGNATD